MKILITGYGKMGRMVEELAQQKGWEILAALDGQDAKLLRQLPQRSLPSLISYSSSLPQLGHPYILFPPYFSYSSILILLMSITVFNSPGN